MNKNKTANRNPTNYHLYHDLIEALIADEDAMDKEVKDMVKKHKRKHEKTMMMMKALQLDQTRVSQQKGEDTIQVVLLALTSTGWQITDTRDAGADSSMHRSDPESEHSDNALIPKVSTTTWFKPIPESERPATPEPEWTTSPNDFPEP
ncbi:hypothetical protein Tco_1141397 [Tanacetum coccineum]